MIRKHQLVEELSLIQTLDLSRDRQGHLRKSKVIGICLGVQKTKGNSALNLGDHGKVARTFEILWLDTQIKSAHVQFEDGHFDAFINEYVVRVYTQEELMNETCTNRS